MPPPLLKIRELELANGGTSLPTFHTGTCTMAEYTHRRNPAAPHLHAQEFITECIRTNAFRAEVEVLVKAAWNHYLQEGRDLKALGNELASVVNRVCPD